MIVIFQTRNQSKARDADSQWDTSPCNNSSILKPTSSRARSIARASSGTIGTIGVSTKMPSRSTRRKVSPGRMPYFSRNSAGRVNTPRSRTCSVTSICSPRRCSLNNAENLQEQCIRKRLKEQVDHSARARRLSARRSLIDRRSQLGSTDVAAALGCRGAAGRLTPQRSQPCSSA